MDKTYLSAPWFTLLHEYEALFGEDKDITIKWRQELGDLYIDLRVRDPKKADALTRLLPNRYKLGDNTVYVEVIPDNINTSNIYLFSKAFRRNPVLSRVVSKQDVTSVVDRNYVVFKKEVVQFFNDEVCDINGNKTLLYEDIARDIFDIQPGIFFCTEGGEPK